ncbi:prepilin-type N-terminal cleavage/methylation domain-containing protein [Stieleria sp. JC731]|uniref:prepilin-type N-terminal cleavage/methylation domain-containing protein n=1 Tax=Pirellulaceae TaxID=2691357 RepID=UPI001E5CD296|nr:prepilin-type N-terminal cleavage/methylation domain-containing protein [Stieleria sp. JC731]MCC9599585.1 prepilin-type N-terminal cleavage/methylation domain-containing protein [Stieleria sp. JC731]
MKPARQFTRNRRSKGFTLREVVISISISSIVLMVSTNLIQQSFQWATNSRHRITDDQRFFMLSGQLRSQIHLASEVTLEQLADTPHQKLVIRLQDGSTVTYESKSQRIAVEHRSETGVLARELYQWQLPRSAHFEVDEATESVKLDVFTLNSHTHLKAPLWRTVQAIAGLRLRYQNAEVDS